MLMFNSTQSFASKAFLLVFAAILIQISSQSKGDFSAFYQKCYHGCLKNCSKTTETGWNSLKEVWMVKVLRWNCREECKYGCKWPTIEHFQKHNWQIPQFFGKWTFERHFGAEEPAAAVAAFLNGFVFNCFEQVLEKNSQ